MPVGTFSDGASPFGVLDMAGNVHEWVADPYGPYQSGAQTNPSGAAPSQPVKNDGNKKEGMPRTVVCSGVAAGKTFGMGRARFVRRSAPRRKFVL